MNWDLVGDWSELGGGLLGGFFAVRLFSAGIVRRVHRLEENTARLSEDLPVLDAGAGADELGRLARGLEKASAVLTQRRREAGEHAETLRRNEATMREGQRQLRLVLQAGSMGCWRLNLSTGESVGDEQLQRLYGWLPGTVPCTLQAFRQQVHPEDLPLINASENAMRVSGREFVVQFRITWPDGTVRWLEDRGTIDPATSEGSIMISGLTMDITKQREAEDALRAAKAEAERANLAKSEFLSRMSHELRTPLNAILGFGQLLMLSPLEEDDSKGVEHILKGGRHLLGLINEVLDLARVEAGHLSISLEPVCVGEIVDEAIEFTRPLTAQRGIRLDSESGPAIAGSYVRADRQRLRQVLFNLVSNAVKYNRDNGRVTLSCSRSENGDRLRIEVTDTGPGISAENLGRLFAPFERLDAEKGGEEGSGLGLALSKRLVEAMNGRIGVESQLGRGSTFWVEFLLTDSPLRLLAETIPPADQAPPAAADAEIKTVLYIEDNLSNLQLLERIFQSRPGLRLRSAMQGSLGLEMARQHRPDLILLDLHLPDLRGDSVLARLHLQPETADIPVVIVSADATPGQVERLLAAGAYAYLTKPFKLAELLGIVDEVVTGST